MESSCLVPGQPRSAAGGDVSKWPAIASASAGTVYSCGHDAHAEAVLGGRRGGDRADRGHDDSLQEPAAPSARPEERQEARGPSTSW